MIRGSVFPFASATAVIPAASGARRDLRPSMAGASQLVPAMDDVVTDEGE